MNSKHILSLGKKCFLLQQTRWLCTTRCFSQSFFITQNRSFSSSNPEIEKTKVNSLNKQQLDWRSSKIREFLNNESKKLQQKINLDFDLSQDVKEETTVYELGDRVVYRVYFGMVILQYIFWAVCANILFSFYSGVDSQGKKLRDFSDEKNKKNTSFTRVWIQNIYASGYQFIVQACFFAIGNLFAFLMLFLITRCVTFIRILPGAKQAKLGTMTVFGGTNPNKYRIVNISDLSSMEHRLEKVNYYSLQQRGKYFSYLIDSQGYFLNEKLYDHTVGVKRNVQT